MNPFRPIDDETEDGEPLFSDYLHGKITGLRRGREEGAAVAFGLMGMAEAIGATEAIRACPHCGAASASRCYCDCAMCGPADCLYWICRTCFDNGRRFVPSATDDRSKADG